MKQTSITVNGTVIQALDNGNVLLNGKQIEDINDVEDVLNALIVAIALKVHP